nr:hypothetical protein Iba_chr13cCG11100 [Ipomoea batatas]
MDKDQEMERFGVENDFDDGFHSGLLSTSNCLLTSVVKEPSKAIDGVFVEMTGALLNSYCLIVFWCLIEWGSGSTREINCRSCNVKRQCLVPIHGGGCELVLFERNANERLSANEFHGGIRPPRLECFII